MDSPTTTRSASNFSTPPRILIPKLVRSRDQWKAKATARKQQYRKEQIHSRDLKISRQQWKERALAAEQRINELQLQLQQSQADLADARSQIAQREDDAQKN
jgi:hypothetical protein